DDNQERLVIALELPQPLVAADADTLLGTIRQAIASDYGIQAAGIVVRGIGEIPRTRTGKVQRSQCARLTASGTWTVQGGRPRAINSRPADQPGREPLSRDLCSLTAE